MNGTRKPVWSKVPGVSGLPFSSCGGETVRRAGGCRGHVVGDAAVLVVRDEHRSVLPGGRREERADDRLDDLTADSRQIRRPLVRVLVHLVAHDEGDVRQGIVLDVPEQTALHVREVRARVRGEAEVREELTMCGPSV